MAKFNAGQAVERLEYDFTDFGGSTGVVAEPTTGQVNAFFKAMKDTMKEAKALQAAGLTDLNIEEMDEQQLAETLGKVDEASEGAEALQRRSVENLSILCGAQRDEDGNITGGSPTFAELDALPFRVLQAFSTWLVDEIRPKGKGPAGKR